MEKYFKSVNCKNIKEIVYNSAKEYGEKTAFVIKQKNGKEVTYKNVSFKEFLNDINAFGTQLYN